MKLVINEKVTAIDLPAVRTRHVYSQIGVVHAGFDTVVLACGGTPETQLWDALQGAPIETHLLGDAYAPRRIVFATQQGFALAMRL